MFKLKQPQTFLSRAFCLSIKELMYFLYLASFTMTSINICIVLKNEKCVILLIKTCPELLKAVHTMCNSISCVNCTLRQNQILTDCGGKRNPSSLPELIINIMQNIKSQIMYKSLVKYKSVEYNFLRGVIIVANSAASYAFVLYHFA